jgi:hypothetical protein
LPADPIFQTSPPTKISDVCGGLSDAIIVTQAAALWKYIANCLAFHNNQFFISVGRFSKLAFFCN